MTNQATNKPAPAHALAWVRAEYLRAVPGAAPWPVLPVPGPGVRVRRVRVRRAAHELHVVRRAAQVLRVTGPRIAQVPPVTVRRPVPVRRGHAFTVAVHRDGRVFYQVHKSMSDAVAHATAQVRIRSGRHFSYRRCYFGRSGDGDGVRFVARDAKRSRAVVMELERRTRASTAQVDRAPDVRPDWRTRTAPVVIRAPRAPRAPVTVSRLPGDGFRSRAQLMEWSRRERAARPVPPVDLNRHRAAHRGMHECDGPACAHCARVRRARAAREWAELAALVAERGGEL